MEPIKFNDTSEYQWLNILDTEGVFTEAKIERQSLPEGFYQYSLKNGDIEAFGEIRSDTFEKEFAGEFITKKPFKLPKSGGLKLKEGDYQYMNQEFNFESFFGCKLSIDCQINIAEVKRKEQLTPRTKDKTVTKSKSYDEAFEL